MRETGRPVASLLPAASATGLSLPTARTLYLKEVFQVPYILLVLILAGLAYTAWKLSRGVAASRPKTRMIGPDDDPDFLRRLGQDRDPR